MSDNGSLFGYYPGCSLTSTARDYDVSVRAVASALGVTLSEVPDWNCCGASPAHAVSEELAVALPVRVLSSARAAGLDTVISPCPACYSRINVGAEKTKKADVRARMAEVTGEDYEGGVRSVHLLDFLLRDVGGEMIKSKVVKPLTGMRIAAYYGCIMRLPAVELDDIEQPTMMEDLLALLGGDPVAWSHRTECCGAGFSMSRTDVVVRLVGEILHAAVVAGADALAVCCPLCQANVDMRQKEAARKRGERFDIPVLYISQLMGLAFGLPAADLGMGMPLVSPEAFLSKWEENLSRPPEEPKKAKAKKAAAGLKKADASKPEGLGGG